MLYKEELQETKPSKLFSKGAFMKTRHWIVCSPEHTYQLSFSTNRPTYIVLDGRRVDIPGYQFRYVRYIDFRLPIDELEVWCRFVNRSYFELYVNGTILSDLEGSVPPRMPEETYNKLTLILEIAFIFCCILVMVSLVFGLL